MADIHLCCWGEQLGAFLRFEIWLDRWIPSFALVVVSFRVLGLSEQDIYTIDLLLFCALVALMRCVAL